MNERKKECLGTYDHDCELAKAVTYKYNKSVNDTTIYLYTKIVYFVRVTCFDLIRWSSGPPRRQIQDLFMFHCIVRSQMLPNFCLRSVKYVSLYMLNLCDGRHTSSTYFTLLKQKFVSIWDLTMQWNINKSWICLLGGPEDHLIRSKHVALTKYDIFIVYKIKCSVIDWRVVFI